MALLLVTIEVVSYNLIIDNYRIYLGLLFECGVDSPLATFSKGLSTPFGRSDILGGLKKLSGLYSMSVYTLLGWSLIPYWELSSSLEQEDDSTTTL